MQSRSSLPHTLSLGSIWYAVAPVALAWNTPGLRVLALVVLPVLAWSWLQDWISCEIAATYHSWRLTPFDILTACNYVALARALERPADDWRLPPSACAHWTGIFAIYIAWNLWIAIESKEDTRKMMLGFSLAELVPLGIAGWLWLGSGSATRTTCLTAIGLLMVSHLGLLVAWRRHSTSRP
jgi:hypothetical protein